MDRRKLTGQRGEQLAADYLAQQGYRILDRNWRCPAGELDLVLEDANTLVFVEVRTRTSRRFGTPEESITPAKQQRLIDLAQLYLQETGAAHAQWRIDVVAIYNERGRAVINHIENAVGW
jgi:putative endonuclease